MQRYLVYADPTLHIRCRRRRERHAQHLVDTILDRVTFLSLALTIMRVLPISWPALTRRARSQLGFGAVSLEPKLPIVRSVHVSVLA